MLPTSHALQEHLVFFSRRDFGGNMINITYNLADTFSSVYWKTNAWRLIMHATVHPKITSSNFKRGWLALMISSSRTRKWSEGFGVCRDCKSAWLWWMFIDLLFAVRWVLDWTNAWSRSKNCFCAMGEKLDQMKRDGWWVSWTLLNLSKFGVSLFVIFFVWLLA